jgi:hypothetical protein
MKNDDDILLGHIVRLGLSQRLSYGGIWALNNPGIYLGSRSFDF